MTAYLNKNTKEVILDNIKAAAQEKIDKSVVGKELAVLVKKTIAATRKAIRKECPNKELAVLQKYKNTMDRHIIDYYVDKKNNINTNWFYGANWHRVNLQFKPPLVIPTSDYFTINTINNDPELLKMYLELYRMDDLLQCEIVKTIQAYEISIYNIRTVKSLLKKYPKMKKYLPSHLGSINTKEDKLIKAFEES